MIEAALKIVDDFLKEQYPDKNFVCCTTNRSFLNSKELTEYTFKVDYLANKDPDEYYLVDTWACTWVAISDNSSGANDWFKDEIFFRYNNIKNPEILVNQLELLGLIKLH